MSESAAISFSAGFLAETAEVLRAIDPAVIDSMAIGLAGIREREGRLFVLGVGGSAGHASHAVCDFRKLCNIEAYCPTDNVSELSARVNDDGWDTTFANWLKVSRVGPKDGVLVFSVGGGDLVRNVSPNLVKALTVATEAKATVFGIVGRDGGFTKKASSVCVVIPPLFSRHVTPHTEGLAAVIWHLLVSHPALVRSATKWESVAPVIA